MNYPEIISVSAAISAAIAAGFSAYVSYRIALLHAYPEIVVYSDQDPRRPGIIVLVVQNVGRAPAYTISFTYSEDLPDRAFGLSVPTSGDPIASMTSGPLVTGIPFLPPGGMRTITWGQYGGLSKALSDRAIRIKAEFYPKESIIGIIPMLTSISLVDIKSHEGTDASDSEPLSRISRELAGIKNAIQNK